MQIHFKDNALIIDMSVDDDDFSYDCPKCGEMPSRGVFLGTQIWHTDCLIDDTITNFNSGSISEDEVQTRFKSMDQTAQTKIEIGIGWKEAVKVKSDQEIQKEFEESKEAEYVPEPSVDEEDKSLEFEPESETISDGENVSAQSSQGSLVQKAKVPNRSKAQDSEEMVQTQTQYQPQTQSLSQLPIVNTSSTTLDASQLLNMLQNELNISLPIFRELARGQVEYAKIYSELIKSIAKVLYNK